MSEVIALGCDVGNTSVKMKTSKEQYRIDTLVKHPYEARKIFDRGDVGEAVKFLDVDIESKAVSGNYYVGTLASRGDGSQESIGGLKCENKILMVAALTSAAYAMAKEYEDRNEFEVALGTGLPVREFFMKNNEGKVDFANVNKYLEQFEGDHTITFNTKLLNNRKIILHFDPEKASILPECYAGLLTEVIGQNGKCKPEYAKNHINILGADIGGASMEIGNLVSDELKKDIKSIEVVTEPVMRNVEAYFNAAKEYEVYGDTE